MDLQEAFDAGFEAVRTYVERSFDAYELRLLDLERRIEAIPSPHDGKDADMGEVRQIVQQEIALLKLSESFQPAAPVLPDIRKMVDEAIDARLPENMEQAIEDAAHSAVAAIPVPQDGKSISVEDVLPFIEASIAQRVAAIPAAKDGVSVSIDDLHPVIEAEVAKRVSELPAPKDGEPGKDADIEVIRSMVKEAVDTLPPAAPGKDADPEIMRLMVNEAVASLPPAPAGKDADPEVIRAMVEEAVSALPPAKDGKSITIDDMLPIMDEALQKAISAIEPPKDGRGITDLAINHDGDLIVNYSDGTEKNAGRALGWDGADVDMEDVLARVKEMFDAVPKPRDGIDGKDGKLSMVKTWADGVHYEGDVVTYGGSLYQAQRDTGKSPDHSDWLCITERGRDGADGRTPKVRETWSESASYDELDIVALNGAAFIAKRDDPGVCPGDGWQMIAAQGKRGHPGERGIGLKGDRGEPGEPVVGVHVDDQGLLTLTNGDGSTTTCDLYPLLSKLS